MIREKTNFEVENEKEPESSIHYKEKQVCIHDKVVFTAKLCLQINYVQNRILRHLNENIINEFVVITHIIFFSLWYVFLLYVSLFLLPKEKKEGKTVLSIGVDWD